MLVDHRRERIRGVRDESSATINRALPHSDQENHLRLLRLHLTRPRRHRWRRKSSKCPPSHPFLLDEKGTKLDDNIFTEDSMNQVNKGLARLLMANPSNTEKFYQRNIVNQTDS